MTNYILGISGAGRSLYELALRERTEVHGIFDNRVPKGTLIDSHSCLGMFHEAEEYVTQVSRFMTCIGSVKSITRRQNMIKRIPIPFHLYASYIAKSAIVETAIDNQRYGIVIFDNVFLGYHVSLGHFVLINPFSFIGHETHVGDYSIIGPSVCIGGNSRIGSSVYIGANSTVRDHVYIADNVIVGCGSNVVSDLSSAGVYYGNPAKCVR